MAVKASATITLVTSVDIDSVYWFYKAQASTTAAPSVPTSVPTKGSAPSGWSLAEPTTVDINQTLYRVELTYFTDGTGIYSTVHKVSSYEGAKVAYNKAQTAQDSADDYYSKLQSMGEQLVVNGSAFMGDNTNFTTWTFDGSVANGTKGSFTKPSDYNGTPLTNEAFPVDITKRYRFEFDAISKDKTARHYSFLNFYDVDGNSILANHHMNVPGSLTTLARELKNGDTVVYLTSAAGWSVSSSTATHMLGFIFWNYTNSKGYTYPENTYSRNTWSNLYTYSAVNKTNNTITLTSAWNNGTFPAGTKVSQSKSGGNYKYGPLSNSLVETTWTHYVSYFDGVDYTGNNVNGKFPPGTSTAKVGFLWNYQKQSTTDQLWITNVSVMEDVKTAISTAQTTATNAQSTANSASTAAATAQATADAKKSMIKINTASRSFTTAQWKTYGAVGHSENWSTGSSYANPNIKVGDTAYLTGTVSDGAGGTATIIGTVTAVNGTNGTSSITMTSQQLIFGGDSVDNVNTKANTAVTNASTALTTANTANTNATDALINTKFNVAIKAGAAITANKLIMDTTTTANTASSYKMVAQNTAYNIESPILFTKAAISSGGTSSDCYHIGKVAAVSGMTVNKPVFLKGTLNGKVFTTVNTTAYITQTEPTSSDTYHYIYLGTAASATEILLQAEHPIYMFTGGSFHRIGSSSDKIIQQWVGGASVAIANAKLNGSYIQANTVTAEQIYVEDLHSLGATIGGFVIDEDSIHTIGYGRTSYDYSSIVVGSFDTNGTENNDAKRVRTPIIDGNVTGIYNDEDTGDYSFTILAWKTSDNSFVGYLTETTNYTLSLSSSNVGYFDYVNMTALRNKYPNYYFRALIRTTSAPNSNINRNLAIDDLYFSVNNTDNIKLSRTDYSNIISSNTRSDWRFNIGNNFGVTSSGSMYASGAVISGSITATSGAIGGFAIDSTSIHTKNVAVTSNASNSVALSSSTFTRTIGGTSRSNLKFAIGSNFGVNASGTLYAGDLIAKSLQTTNTVNDTWYWGSTANGDPLMYKWDHIVYFSSAGSLIGNLDMYFQAKGVVANDWCLPESLRPDRWIYAPAVIRDTSTSYKLGCLRIRPEGWVDLYLYNSYGANSTSLKNNGNYYNDVAQVYFTATWIVP